MEGGREGRREKVGEGKGEREERERGTEVCGQSATGTAVVLHGFPHAAGRSTAALPTGSTLCTLCCRQERRMLVVFGTAEYLDLVVKDYDFFPQKTEITNLLRRNGNMDFKTYTAIFFKLSY